MARKADIDEKAYSAEDTNDELRDIRLLCNENDRQRYACGKCQQLAINAKVLNCSNHDMDLTLYCDKCALLIVSEDKCPVVEHKKPTFCNTKTDDTIKRNLKFMCPYSLRSVNQNIVGPVDDTLNEGKNPYEPIGCDWKGNYIELNNHVKICKFKPKENKSIIDMKTQINLLNDDMSKLKNDTASQLNQLQDTVTALQGSVNSLSKATDEKINNINVNIEKITTEFNNKFQTIQDSIQNLQTGVKTPTQSDNWNISLILSMVCCILFSTMGYYIYEQQKIVNKINEQCLSLINGDMNGNFNDNADMKHVFKKINLTFKDLNLTMLHYHELQQSTNDKLVKQLNDINVTVKEAFSKMNRLNESMQITIRNLDNQRKHTMNQKLETSKDSKIQLDDLNPDLQEQSATDTEQIDDMASRVKWIGYYGFKLILQIFNCGCILVGYIMHWNERDLKLVCAVGMVISRVLIEWIWMFHSTNVVLSCLFAAALIGIGLIVSLYFPSKHREPIGMMIVQLNVWYWRFFSADNILLTIVTLFWWMFMAFVFFTGGPPASYPFMVQVSLFVLFLIDVFVIFTHVF